MKPVYIATGMLGSCLLFAMPALASKIDFESGDTVNPIETFLSDDSAVSGSITVSGGIDYAFLYDTTTAGADPDLEQPFFDAAEAERTSRTDNDTSGVSSRTGFGNALIVQENEPADPDTPPDDNIGGTITFIFDGLVNVFSADVLDASNGNVSFEFLGATDNSIFTYENLWNGDSDSAPNWYETVIFGDGVTNVRTLVVTFDGVSGALDNIHVSPVPIPAAAGFFLLGALGALGIARRKRAC